MALVYPQSLFDLRMNDVAGMRKLLLNAEAPSVPSTPADEESALTPLVSTGQSDVGASMGSDLRRRLGIGRMFTVSAHRPSGAQ